MVTLARERMKSPQAILLLVVFLAMVVGIGALVGTQSQPGVWYESLQKPPFNPPNWVFGPTWFTLYVLIAIAGWRTALRQPMGLAMGLWIVQMLLNWAWSPTWFVAESLWGAFAIIVPMWFAILAYIWVNRRADPVAAWLFVPYLAWVSFATLLNLSIALLNT